MVFTVEEAERKDGRKFGSVRQSAHLGRETAPCKSHPEPSQAQCPQTSQICKLRGSSDHIPAGRQCPLCPALTQCTEMGHLYYLGKCYSLGNSIFYIKFPISSSTEANQGGKSLWRGTQRPCSACSHYSLHSFPSPKQTTVLCIPKTLQGCFPAPTSHQSPSQPDSYRGSPPPLPAFQLIKTLFTHGLQGGNKSTWGEASLHGQRLCKQTARGDRGCLLCVCAAGLEGDTALPHPNLPFPFVALSDLGSEAMTQPAAQVCPGKCWKIDSPSNFCISDHLFQSDNGIFNFQKLLHSFFPAPLKLEVTLRWLSSDLPLQLDLWP